MLSELNDAESENFVERIAATAIVNQAALKCLIRGLPADPDNIIRFVGDYFDPSRSEFAELVGQIMCEIDQLVGVRRN